MTQEECLRDIRNIIRKHFGLFASNELTSATALEIYVKVVTDARHEGEKLAAKHIRRLEQERDTAQAGSAHGYGLRGQPEATIPNSEGAEAAHANHPGAAQEKGDDL